MEKIINMKNKTRKNKNYNKKIISLVIVVHLMTAFISLNFIFSSVGAQNLVPPEIDGGTEVCPDGNCPPEKNPTQPNTPQPQTPQPQIPQPQAPQEKLH